MSWLFNPLFLLLIFAILPGCDGLGGRDANSNFPASTVDLIGKLIITKQVNPDIPSPDNPNNDNYLVGDTLVISYTSMQTQVEVHYLWLREGVAIDGANTQLTPYYLMILAIILAPDYSPYRRRARV